MKPFVVISSNPSNEGKTFVTKLQRKTEVEHSIFGIKQKSETYYISGTKQIALGHEVSESDLFPSLRVVEREMLNPETGEKFIGKWLSAA